MWETQNKDSEKKIVWTVPRNIPRDSQTQHSDIKSVTMCEHQTERGHCPEVYGEGHFGLQRISHGMFRRGAKDRKRVDLVDLLRNKHGKTEG